MMKPLSLAIAALVLTSVAGCGDEGPNRDDEAYLTSAHASTSTFGPILMLAAGQTIAYPVIVNGVQLVQSTGIAQVFVNQNGLKAIRSNGTYVTASTPGSSGGGGTASTGTSGTGATGQLYTTGGGASYKMVYTSWGYYYWIYA